MKKILAVVSILAFASAGAAQATEIIRGTAARIGSGRSQTSFLNVTLERYSTDAERAQWREAFVAGGQAALIAAWQKSDVSVGQFSFTGTMAYPVRAAITVPLGDGGRKVYIATDRPIAGAEYLGGARTEDYPMGWIEVEIPEKGKGGEGMLVGAAEAVVEGNRLTIKSIGTETVRLINVSITEK